MVYSMVATLTKLESSAHSITDSAPASDSRSGDLASASRTVESDVSYDTPSKRRPADKRIRYVHRL